MLGGLKYLMHIVSFEIMYSMASKDLLESVLHLAFHNNSWPFSFLNMLFQLQPALDADTAVSLLSFSSAFTFQPLSPACPPPRSHDVWGWGTERSRGGPESPSTTLPPSPCHIPYDLRLGGKGSLCLLPSIPFCTTPSSPCGWMQLSVSQLQQASRPQIPT